MTAEGGNTRIESRYELFHRVDVRSALDSLGQARKSGLLGRQMKRKRSLLEQQAANALRRARRLPIGAERNDLRQLAMGLLWLHRNGMDALMKQRLALRQTLIYERADKRTGGAGH
ncbi:MAG: hypothetical protein QOJ42_2827 [Acidobacteriaceae bacterium]|jgi:hypothetical protein|nr:hypothetical protein [Acidobacteriaceae bacterium]